MLDVTNLRKILGGFFLHLNSYGFFIYIIYKLKSISRTTNNIILALKGCRWQRILMLDAIWSCFWGLSNKRNNWTDLSNILPIPSISIFFNLNVYNISYQHDSQNFSQASLQSLNLNFFLATTQRVVPRIMPQHSTKMNRLSSLMRHTLHTRHIYVNWSGHSFHLSL
jgi:hypothetical protein